MKQKKENSMALLLHWAGEQKFWLFLAILLSMCSGLCIIVPYIGISFYQADIFCSAFHIAAYFPPFASNSSWVPDSAILPSPITRI